MLVPMRSNVQVTARRNRTDPGIVPGKVRRLAASTSVVSQLITDGLLAAVMALRSLALNLALPTQPTARFIRRLRVTVVRADSCIRGHHLNSRTRAALGGIGHCPPRCAP